jgi:sRNA-binding regulator protein Hfq
MSKQIVQDNSETLTAVLEPTLTQAPAVVVPPASKKIAVHQPPVAGPPQPVSPARKKRSLPVSAPTRRFPATHFDDDSSNRQAELFYLQKQIQQQTPMVFILEDGERIQGIVEWYDRHSIKVRGKSRVLIYKTAIKYLYKAGEIGSAPEK